MANPVLTGAVLIETNGAALNNAGQDQGTRTDNAIVVKQIRMGRLRYPYVSGQAWRRWWREVLYADFAWQPSEVTVIRRPQQAFTEGNPISREEDDLFGYMVARKEGTFRRISPLKNSLLVSVLPNVIERDFGHFTRNLPPEANPLLYEAEHYTAALQGVFTISLADVGYFQAGAMGDLSEDILQANNNGLQALGEQLFCLPSEQRIKRVQDTIRALARLRGGARLARNLSDVAPVAVLVGFLDGGNAPFQRLFEADANHERVALNLQRLRSVLNDYHDRLLAAGDSASIYFGYHPTVLGNEEDVINTFKNDEFFRNSVAISGTPKAALDAAADAVAGVFAHHLQ